MSVFKHSPWQTRQPSGPEMHAFPPVPQALRHGGTEGPGLQAPQWRERVGHVGGSQ